MSLYDEIRALPAELLATQDTQAIAVALSAGRTQVVSADIGVGLVLETLGINEGNALLDIIKSNADFRYVWPLIEQGRLNVGSLLVRGTLDSLATAGAITQGSADALKALVEQPDPIDEMAVRKICWSDDGVWQV